jgi:hypothetical protein
MEFGQDFVLVAQEQAFGVAHVHGLFSLENETGVTLTHISDEFFDLAGEVGEKAGSGNQNGAVSG